MDDWSKYYAKNSSLPPAADLSPYNENGDLKIMSLKFYFESRGIKWHAPIPASVKREYKLKGLKL